MEDNQFLWNQLIKLGDMMGDGLHHEPDGKWISDEYGKIARILMPDTFKEIKKAKALRVNTMMNTLLSEKKCNCGGTLKQARSGSKIAYCQTCKARYKAKITKTTNE